ncbi:MAG: NAD+ synthase [Microbacteriaceae bacterium]|nr:NAD+ synthase [Microbacteriaceae bacterium]
MRSIQLAAVQTNPIVGDFQGNANQIISACKSIVTNDPLLAVTGELALTGYPVDDLAFELDFVTASVDALNNLATNLVTEGLADIYLAVGFVDALAQQEGPRIASNSLAILHRGEVIAKYRKQHLPNFSVFDEQRIFTPGAEPLVMEIADVRTGFIICEDLWHFEGPVRQLAEKNVDLTVVLNASPFEIGKQDERLSLLKARAAEIGSPILYVNNVGGQDDLVFDGGSILVDKNGDPQAGAKRFESDAFSARISWQDSVIFESANPAPENLETNEEIWRALTLGLRDYLDKNRISAVVLGLSGGIDSALCATIAVDAIGASRVFGVSMPSKFSSEHSVSDAEDLANRLGIHYRTETIEELVTPLIDQLGLSGIAAENAQARIRGMVLMSISNMEGQLVLTTGNKTEVAVGYSTMYGDSVGGFAPIKDAPKTLVWELSKWRNEQSRLAGKTEPIPENSITKPPSAELRENQKDQDSLPEYALLDQILELLIIERLSASEIITAGFDANTVERVNKLVLSSEWKRRQSAPGTRISRVAFGKDRRMPLTVRRNA